MNDAFNEDENWVEQQTLFFHINAAACSSSKLVFLFCFASIWVHSSIPIIFSLNAAHIKDGSIYIFLCMQFMFAATIKGAAAIKCFHFYLPPFRFEAAMK